MITQQSGNASQSNCTHSDAEAIDLNSLGLVWYDMWGTCNKQKCCC